MRKELLKEFGFIVLEEFRLLAFLAPGLKMAKSQGTLGSCGIFATHFLINTETRPLCLLRLELSSQILLQPG